MATPICELCTSSAKLICYCRKAYLCDLCVGKHFLSEPSLAHKPIALSQAAIYEETLPALRENEERLMGEIMARGEVTAAAKEKLSSALVEMSEIEKAIDEAVEQVKREVVEEMDRMRGELRAEWERERGKLQEAANHFGQGEGGKCGENQVVRVLEDLGSATDIAALQLIHFQLDIHTSSLLPDLRKTIAFSLQLASPHKLPHSKTSDFKRASLQDTALKPVGKGSLGTAKKPGVAKTEARHSAAQPHAATIGKKATQQSGKPSNAFLTVKKDSKGRRSSALEANPFPLLPDLEDTNVKSDEDFNLLADDSPPPFLKLPTEIPKRSSPSPSRFTPSNSRQTQSFTKKIEESASGTAGHKSKRPVSDTFTPVGREDEGKGKLVPPVLNVISPEGERKMRSPRRSSTLEETPPKVKPTIHRATEVSRSPASLTPPSSPPQQSAGMTFPQQTFLIPPEGRAIVLLDLESNVAAVKEFALPEGERFGEDLAWCCSLYGEVFLLGGRSNATVLSSVYLYNPGTDELEGGCSLLTARFRHCALYYQDTIYVIGGTGTGGASLRDCEKFEIRKKTGKHIGNLSVARESHSACIFEGKIYVAGGPHTDTLEVIVPLLETFSVVRLKCACSGPTAMLADGEKIVILQGNVVMWVWPNDRSSQEAGKLPEYGWWCSGPPILSGGWHYFIRQGLPYRFNSAQCEMIKLSSPLV